MTNTKPKLRAHFVGAPFFVPRTARDLHSRFSATGYNTGNLLIGDAVARLLDVEIVGLGGAIADFSSFKTSVDLIVIPSANFLSPTMDLSWLIPIVEHTTQPILMVGVGAQYPTTDVSAAELPKDTLRLMQMISERSRSISVRGAFTAEVLKKHGINNVRVTGCPSLFRLGNTALTVTKPDTKTLNPIFNGSSNVLRHASSAENARRVELKLLQLGMESNAAYILQNELPEMLAAAGASREEYEAGCKATLRGLQANVALDEYVSYVKQHAKTFFEVDHWASFISQHNLVVGTRFHGNMIAISQGIAAVFIAHDSRTTELCEALHIPYLDLPAFLEADLSRIVESLDFEAFEKSYPKARENFAEFFAENGVQHRMHEGANKNIDEAFRPIYEGFASGKLPSKSSSNDDKIAAIASSSRDLVELMKEYITEHDFSSAILAHAKVNQSHPKYVGATLLLAESLITENASLSSELAERAIQLGARDAKSYWIWARSLHEAGHREKASDAAKAGLQLSDGTSWTAELSKLVH